METKLNGVVERLFIAKGYGWIREIDPDDEGVANQYFVHARFVISGKLKVGAKVVFEPRVGDKGRWAANVEVVSAPPSPITWSRGVKTTIVGGTK